VKRILMIDNYDSFTYNLVQYLGELGAQVTVWRNDQFGLEDVAEFDPDGLVVSPGPCTPKEAGLSVPLIQKYLRVLPHSSTPAILRSTRLRMRLWTRRMRFTRATRPQKDRASIR
jgi:GMP synthase-like glutamine amidotransferase